MQAIEFEATAYQHSIKIPGSIPDGIPMRVLVLLADTQPAPPSDVKTLLAMLVEGMTDDDLARPLNLGRESEKWDI